jgi:hypothetical protein
MGDELPALESAKSGTLAAIAAAVDLSDEPETAGNRSALDSLRAAAVRHLKASLEIMGRAKGGDR